MRRPHPSRAPRSRRAPTGFASSDLAPVTAGPVFGTLGWLSRQSDPGRVPSTDHGGGVMAHTIMSVSSPVLNVQCGVLAGV